MYYVFVFIFFKMETILDTTFRFANEIKKALELAISNSNVAVYEKGEKCKKTGVGDALGRTLKHVRKDLYHFSFYTLIILWHFKAESSTIPYCNCN